jgi:signal peptidase I
MAFSYARRPGAGPEGKRGRGGLLRLIVSVVVLAWMIRSFFFALFSIPSGSMLPTLFVGDYVLTAKWPYGYSRYSFPWSFPPVQGRFLANLPKRGDVVVFRVAHANEDYVKRVIGLPGDTVAVREGMLVLNGRRIPREDEQRFSLPVSANTPCRVVAGATPMISHDQAGEPICLFPTYRETLPGGRSYRVIDQVDNPGADEVSPRRVPAGHVFLMGDNRDDSLDSRFSPAEGGIGFVSVENLVGRATMIFWSTDGTAEYVKPWTWFSALRGRRIGTTFGGEGEE